MNNAVIHALLVALICWMLQGVKRAMECGSHGVEVIEVIMAVLIGYTVVAAVYFAAVGDETYSPSGCVVGLMQRALLLSVGGYWFLRTTFDLCSSF